MGDDVIVFNPEKPMAYEEVLSSLVSYQLFTIAGSIIVIYIFRDMPFLVFTVTCIGACSILFSVFFGRYPVQVMVNKKTRFLKAYYWDCFGNMKTVLIDLDKAVVTYRQRSRSIRPNDRVLLVYDNIFNNWIKIDKTKNFPKDQLDTMFELLMGLKNK